MYGEDLRSCSDKDGYICGVTIASFIKRTIFDIADEAVNDIYSPNNKIYYNLPAHYSYSFLIQHNPEFVALGVPSRPHESDASIKFSPADVEDSKLGISVAAILSHPETAQQRDTYGWTYVIGYEKRELAK